MDWNEVAVFARVVEAGSFTRAAEQLGVPKSTVSRRVSRLEQALGVRLLQRTTRRLSLTDAGAAYHERITRALAELEEANAFVADLEGAPRGSLRLTAPPDLAQLLGGLIAGFQTAYPDIRVDATMTARMVDLVGEGFDVALRAGRLRDSSLVARKVGELVSVVVASPAYLEGRKRPAQVADLARQDCLLFRAKDHRDTWALVRDDGTEAEVRVSGRLVTDDYGFLRSATLGGAGVSLLPWYHARRPLADGRLVRLLSRWAWHGAALYLVTPTGRHVPRKVTAFKDYVLDQVAAGQLSPQ